MWKQFAAPALLVRHLCLQKEKVCSGVLDAGVKVKELPPTHLPTFPPGHLDLCHGAQVNHCGVRGSRRHKF
jgi:hypothetical protein